MEGKIPVFTTRRAFFSFAYPDIWCIDPDQQPELVEIKMKESPKLVIIDSEIFHPIFIKTYEEIFDIIETQKLDTEIVIYGHSSNEATGCRVVNNEKSLKKLIVEKKNEG